MNDDLRDMMWRGLERKVHDALADKVRGIIPDMVELAYEWLANDVNLDLDDHGNVVVSVGESADRVVALAPLHEVVERWMELGPSDPDSARLKDTLERAVAVMETEQVEG